VTPLIRPATRSDLPALTAIEESCFPRPHWDAGDFLRFRCTVALAASEIGGFLVSRQTAPADSLGGAEHEILNVGVDPRFRRSGLATALLLAEIQPGATYFLEVRESNFPAQSLYRKLGFREIGRRPRYYSNPMETAIVMQVK